MKVYKLGGAFVQNVKNVRNILKVLNQTEYYSTIIVVSAMGKSTNSLEDIIQAYFQKNVFYKEILGRIVEKYFEEVKKFFTYSYVYLDIKSICRNLGHLLFNNKSDNFNYLNGQVVNFGEIISPKILSLYLNYSKITNTWIKIINYSNTNFNYKSGAVGELIYKHFKNSDTSKTYVTQDSLISNYNYFTISLDREASDYHTNIIAYCLNSKGVIIWNDITKIRTGDVNYIENTLFLESLSYKEIMYISFYKSPIPLSIISFLEPENQRTSIIIGAKGDLNVSCFIRNLNVHLLTISSGDFIYNPEGTLYIIFKQITELNIKISMISIPAFSVSLVIEDKFNSINILLNILANSFNVTLEENVRLLYCNK